MTETLDTTTTEFSMTLEECLAQIATMCEGLRAEMKGYCATMDAKYADLCSKMDAAPSAGFLKASTTKLAADDDGDPMSTMAQQVSADRRADSVSRSELEVLRAQLRDLQMKQPRPQTAADRDAFADAQAKFDATYRAIGDSGAPPPMSSEDIVSYNIRLARPLQKHSKKFKSAELHVLARDPSTLNSVIDSIRADAFEVGISPVGMPEFAHREVRTESAGGHKITSFVGRGTMFKMMSRPVRHVSHIGATAQGRSASGQVFAPGVN
jgi:hypothetical protein